MIPSFLTQRQHRRNAVPQRFVHLTIYPADGYVRIIAGATPLSFSGFCRSCWNLAQGPCPVPVGLRDCECGCFEFLKDCLPLPRACRAYFVCELGLPEPAFSAGGKLPGTSSSLGIKTPWNFGWLESQSRCPQGTHPHSHTLFWGICQGRGGFSSQGILATHF